MRLRCVTKCSFLCIQTALCINCYPLLISFPLVILISEELRQADNMGEGDWDSPKLPIFSIPRQKPPGLLTPPLHPRVVVPFQWEEEPGKPRPCLTRSPYCPPVVTEGVKRSLDLPPRLQSQKLGATTAFTNSITIPSPTTVLEGPHPCHRKTWSFRRLGSGEKMVFGSSGRACFGSSFPFHDCKKVETPGREDRGSASGISISEFYCRDCNCDHEETNSDTKVKITRVKRRRRSFLSLLPTKSHLWERIYEGLKQVVPWRRPSKNNTRRSKIDLLNQDKVCPLS